MRIDGEHRFDAPPEVVFEAIHDPDQLLASIPGCASVERVSDTEYHGRIAIRMPAVGGTYDMTIRLIESVAPSSCLLDGEVEGRTGRVEGRVALRLTPDGPGTQLAYEGDARLSGALAWLDSALVARVAGSIIEGGLARLAATLDPRDSERPDTGRQGDHEDSSMETVA